MGMKVRLGGEWKDITGAKVFKSGAWRTLVAVKVFKGGAWRTVANFTPPGGGGGGGGSLSLSLSTTTIHKTGHSSSLTTPSVTVTPSGGLAPYTYAWSVVSSDGLASYSITAPSSASTGVSATGLPADTGCGEVIHCHVTDSLGVSANSANVTASFFYSSLS